MGQKVNPIGIRLGITRDWSSKWYADQRTFPHYIAMDYKIREFLKKKLKEASVSKILIERPARKAHITIHTARPGVVIGKKGEDIESLRAQVAKLLKMPVADVRINIAEIRKPELDAKLVAEGVLDRCGMTLLAGKAVGAPFVGSVAACLALSEVLRLLHGGQLHGLIDLDLLSPEQRTVSRHPGDFSRFNPGFSMAG